MTLTEKQVEDLTIYGACAECGMPRCSLIIEIEPRSFYAEVVCSVDLTHDQTPAYEWVLPK